MLQAVRAPHALPSIDDGTRLLERWRAHLLHLHFTPWRIDHDLQTVTACLRDLGPLSRWTDTALRLRFGRRGGRAVTEATLEEIAARRFLAFCCAPDEHALHAEILAAWWDQLTVAGRKVETREKYRDAILLFADSGGLVWRAKPQDVNAFGAAHVEAGGARESLRGSQGIIRRFINFTIDPADAWDERVFALTGCRVRQLCTPANTLAHLHTSPEGEVGRALTNAELRRFFGHLRHVRETALSYRRKGRWTAARDYALYQFMLATGARDSDLDGLALHDLPPSYGATAAFSPFEEVHFLGKSDPGGPPKPRIVPAIELFASQWATLAWYLRSVRPHLMGARSGDAAFLSERGSPLQANDISRIFHDYRVAAGLPAELHAHCLRHTFAQRLRQIGVDIAIIQTLLGHNAESTTVRYAKLTPAFIKDRLLECGRRQCRESYAPR